MRLVRLDGLRAVAIIAVIVSHHAMFSSYGWAGVDLFFVLSGFLITQILRRSSAEKQYWRPFYTKRAFRILPAMFMLIVVTAITAHGWTLKGFLFYIFFLGNFVDVTKYSIFLLGVLWSLAVEEHFYFVWPIAVRFLRRRDLLLLAIFVILAEPVIRYLATPHVHSFFTIYELTQFRLDGLAAGALLALLVERSEDRAWLARLAPWLAFVSGAALALLPLWFPHFVREDNTALFNAFGYSLVVLACFAVITWVYLHETSIGAKLLGWRPLVFVGEISYGMYLYHRVVMSTLFRFLHIRYDAGHQNGLRAMLLIDLPLTIAISALSFRWLEAPLMKRGRVLAGAKVASDARIIETAAR